MLMTQLTSGDSRGTPRNSHVTSSNGPIKLLYPPCEIGLISRLLYLLQDCIPRQVLGVGESGWDLPGSFTRVAASVRTDKQIAVALPIGLRYKTRPSKAGSGCR
jgi:hypothetical protein